MDFYEEASLVMVPSGYKDQKVYSSVPDDGSADLTFSRASNATRVNSEGLVEKVRTNLALYSEDQTNWTDQIETSVTANAAANPLNGAVTADKVIPSAVTSDHYRGLLMGSMVGEISSSIYVKADGYSIIDYGIWNATLATYPVRAVFDLSTETITHITGSISSITSVGSGWYRISVTGLVASTGTIGIYHRVRPSGTGGTYVGDGTSGMLLWGCQLESGVATDYVGPTTSVGVSVGPVSGLPRLNYDAVNPTSASLLLEPQRTNLNTYSEDISQSGQYLATRVTISKNSVVSPDGYQNADKIVQDPSNTSWGGVAQGISPAGLVTLSLFAKKIDNDYIAIIGHNSIPTAAWFNIATGTAGTTEAGVTSSKIEAYGNGWYRCSITTSVCNRFSVFHTTADGGTTAPVNSETALWGFQQEDGVSYATSYIPTLSTAVTRVADTYQKGGFGNTSTAGTLYYEFEATKIDSVNGKYLIILFAGSSISNPDFAMNNSISICGNGPQIQGYNDGYGQLLFSTTPAVGSTLKVALRYDGTNVVAFLNGVKETVFADTAVGVKNAIRVNNAEKGTQATKQLLFFPTALSDADCITLTTL